MDTLLQLGAVSGALISIITLLVKIWRLLKRATDGVEKINQIGRAHV